MCYTLQGILNRGYCLSVTEQIVLFVLFLLSDNNVRLINV